jgi:hypothetical protein
VATTFEGLDGARVELTDLATERHSERVMLRFGDNDAGVSLADDLAVVWGLIVEADRRLARLSERRRAR